MSSVVQATWTLVTASGAGAVGIVQVCGDVDAALDACGIARVGVGDVRVRELMGVDRGVAARISESVCQLMPHGGVAVVRGVLAELTARGIAEERRANLRALFPEARSEVEARALEALSRAASPLAVDLLLAQHELWSEPGAVSDPERDRVLMRLIDPPLVVAVGASNIGKSTLVNALAGRSVSVVADEPGTTRDHVGVMLDLGGLVVRYVDTPGLREGASTLEQEALAGAMQVSRNADLLLVCGDAGSGLPELPDLETRSRIVIALRADLGMPSFVADVTACAQRGEGLAELVALIKTRLVGKTIEGRLPWRFW